MSLIALVSVFAGWALLEVRRSMVLERKVRLLEKSVRLWQAVAEEYKGFSDRLDAELTAVYHAIGRPAAPRLPPTRH